MLTITITIGEFGRTEGREGGPARGTTKAPKNGRESAPPPSRAWLFLGNGGNLTVERHAGFTPDSRRNVAWAE